MEPAKETVDFEIRPENGLENVDFKVASAMFGVSDLKLPEFWRFGIISALFLAV